METILLKLIELKKHIDVNYKDLEDREYAKYLVAILFLVSCFSLSILFKQISIIFLLPLILIIYLRYQKKRLRQKNLEEVEENHLSLINDIIKDIKNLKGVNDEQNQLLYFYLVEIKNKMGPLFNLFKNTDLTDEINDQIQTLKVSFANSTIPANINYFLDLEFENKGNLIKYLNAYNSLSINKKCFDQILNIRNKLFEKFHNDNNGELIKVDLYNMFDQNTINLYEQLKEKIKILNHLSFNNMDDLNKKTEVNKLFKELNDIVTTSIYISDKTKEDDLINTIKTSINNLMNSTDKLVEDFNNELIKRAKINSLVSKNL